MTRNDPPLESHIADQTPYLSDWSGGGDAVSRDEMQAQIDALVIGNVDRTELDPIFEALARHRRALIINAIVQGLLLIALLVVAL